MDAMHPYEKLPLFGTGLALGIALTVGHAVLLVKSESSQRFLKTFHRQEKLGQFLLAIGMIWFWLLVAPSGKGALNFLAMDLGEEFNRAKDILRLAVPIAIVLVAISVKEYLSVRALGLLGLMVGMPLLQSAFLKDPQSRLLIPIYCYAMIIASLYFVGMPYVFRDAVKWATATQTRWRLLTGAGLAYGLVMIACALIFWKGY
jgi:hypothetical protein